MKTRPKNYLEKFPDGKACKGAARGNLSLVGYTQSQGHRESTDTVGQSPRMDFEAFSVHMETVRKWKMARVLLEWGTLKDDSAVPRDENGPKGASLRLTIPSWMAVTDFEEHRFGSFQEKRVDTTLKPKAMGLEDKAKLVADCGRGFGKLEKVDRDEARQAAQTPAVISITGGYISASDFLKTAASQVVSTDDADAHLTPASGKKTPAPLEDSSSSRKRGVSDIGTARQNARSSVTETFAKDDAKMWKSIEATMVELHKFDTDPCKSIANQESHDIFGEMVERLSVALLYMGSEFAKGPDGKTDYSAKRGAPISVPAPIEPQLALPPTVSSTALATVGSDDAPGDGEAPIAVAAAASDEGVAATAVVAAVAPPVVVDLGQYNTKLLRLTLASLPYFPMEAPEEFMSRCELKEFPMLIKAATCDATIETLVATVDNHVVQTGQLMDALESTRKGLKKELAKIAKDKKTKESAEKAKEEEDRKKLQAGAELTLKKRLLVQKNKNTWEVDWNAAAHCKIDDITGETGWDAFASDALKCFDAPLILTDWKPLDDVFKAQLDETGKKVDPDITKTMASWALKFPTSKSGETSNKSTAPAL
jgi:hypothetical protein